MALRDALERAKAVQTELEEQARESRWRKLREDEQRHREVLRLQAEEEARRLAEEQARADREEAEREGRVRVCAEKRKTEAGNLWCCAAEFVISVGEAAWYAERRWALPLRCPSCRERRKLEKETRENSLG